MTNTSWMPANWPAPQNIRAGCTTRLGGYSLAPYDSLNLAMHVGDNPSHVQQNRQLLVQQLQLPAEPHWLEQVHGCDVSTDSCALIQADAAMTTQPGKVCVVMTADCLPLLITDQQGSCVAAIHAGWRGLANGVIAQTIKQIPVAVAELLVWLGPAIGPQHFEVGADVFDAFVRQDEQYRAAFRDHNDKWLMNIYQAARLQLQSLGVRDISGGDYCTYEDAQHFYSYRRERQTGRMASLIWRIDV